MDPYEADSTKIPETDLYFDVPFFGRYLRRDSDFQPKPECFNSITQESLTYWESVLEKCDESALICPGGDNTRDVFALGSIIVKSDHLKAAAKNETYHEQGRDFSSIDANEVEAIKIARAVLKDTQVPTIYFSNKIRGKDVLIQSRLPGVALDVAWPYLSATQKAMFKEKVRDVIARLHTISASPDTGSLPSYIVANDDPLRSRNITELEYNLLFSSRKGQESGTDEDLGFVHNDLNPSNIIVDKDEIVGLIDWEMAGYFGLKRAGAVHSALRTPNRECFADLDLSEETLNDLTYWSDLYAFEPESKRA